MPISAQQRTFPVDAVFTWVDGADPVWQAQKQRLRQERFAGGRAPGDADNEARFQDNDELRFALRSIALYAPWIRTLHLVTADQKPEWLNTDTVNLVSHRDIFPKDVPLPVFSNRPIEFCVHRVPGLAEHFVYFNDDVMLGRPVSRADFFLPDGRPLIWVVKRGRKSMQKTLSRLGSGMSHASTVARGHALITTRYGRSFPYIMRHFPKAMTRSTASALWEAFPEAVTRTLHAPFRSPGDASVTILYPLFALAEGLGRARVINGLRQAWDVLSGRGIAHVGASINDRNAGEKMRLIRRLRPRTFCLNDAPGSSDADRRRLVEFLDALFPEPCKYERSGA